MVTKEKGGKERKSRNMAKVMVAHLPIQTRPDLIMKRVSPQTRRRVKYLIIKGKRIGLTAARSSAIIVKNGTILQMSAEVIK